MKYWIILLAGTFALAQEGKAVRPAPKPECVAAASDPAVESCTFGKYRFTRTGLDGFTVSRMESGNYIPTTLFRALKDPERSLAVINSRFKKDAKKKRLAGDPCPELWPDADADGLMLRFDNKSRGVFTVADRGNCPAEAIFTARELDAMFK